MPSRKCSSIISTNKRTRRSINNQSVDLVKPKKCAANQGKLVNKFPRYYEVDYVLGKRVVNGETQMLLKWKNYSDEHNSWEIVSNVTPDLVQDYNNHDAMKLVNCCLDDGKEMIMLRDIPKKIVDIRKDFSGNLEYLVKWCNEKGKNWLPGQILKIHYPHLVIRFYEEITVIVD